MIVGVWNLSIDSQEFIMEFTSDGNVTNKTTGESGNYGIIGDVIVPGWDTADEYDASSAQILSQDKFETDDG